MAYTQKERLIAIETSPPLVEDELLLQGFTGHEGISRLFSFHLDLLSENFSIDFKDIVGKSVTVKIKLSDGETHRYLNGHVSRFSQSGSDLNFAHYRAEVVPWLWFLTRNANCRIFQNMKVPDIIQKVFNDRGFTDFRLSLQGQYDALEYCVQYRETDFNFVSRLMEQNGIFYFFEHSDGKHVLVLGDKPSVHQSCPYQDKMRFDQMAGGPEEEDVVTAWVTEAELHTGKYSLTDYNFKTPTNKLLVNEPTIISVADNSRYEIYDYPGDYIDKGEGQAFAKIRMQEQEAQYAVSSGSSVCRVFTSGYKFNLEEYYRDDVNTAYVLTEVEHRASVGGSYIAGGSAGETYSNQFTCIPAAVPFRPPRTTLKPFVQGPQTAKVVGPSGEEIWVDKYGRVKVQFYWDREGQEDENSSCWIRVSQIIAGSGWGAMFIPRMGQEVIVDFLEGDPDRPIITGRVYNAEQMPPGTLPDHQNVCGLRSHSTKGSEGHNANVLAFVDTKGSEVFYMRAEKDMATRVEHNDDLKVGNDQTQDIGHDRTTTIHHDKTMTVLNNRTSNITASDSETVGKDQSVTIGTSQSNTIGTSQTNTIGTSQTNTIGASQTAEIGGTETHTVGGALMLACGGAMEVAVGGATMVTSGGPLMITAPIVLINGVLVVTQSIVSPIYSPGLGNLI